MEKQIFLCLVFVSVNLWTEAKVVLNYDEDWGYVKVRPHANLFWWLYNVKTDVQRPLIMWLQGGPGSSSSGYGNFVEIGPLDEHLNPRPTSWLIKSDLLFVDNPVGTGFSYVTDKSAYTTDVQQISNELMNFSKLWFSQHPKYQKVPFFVFGESYGGKVAAVFALHLYNAIQAKEIAVDFRGIGLGNSWISPVDFYSTWGKYLHAFSYLNKHELLEVEDKIGLCKSRQTTNWHAATHCVFALQGLISKYTFDASWYYILKKNDVYPWSTSSTVLAGSREKRTYRKSGWHINLERKLNNEIRAKLKIIPDWLHWEVQSQNVSYHQRTDFLKPVVKEVDHILNSTNLKVVVYTGQLDLICNPLGTEEWLSKLSPSFSVPLIESGKSPFYVDEIKDRTAGFTKRHKNLDVYWFLNAGHMVPHDVPYASFKMLDVTLGNCKSAASCPDTEDHILNRAAIQNGPLVISLFILSLIHLLILIN